MKVSASRAVTTPWAIVVFTCAGLVTNPGGAYAYHWNVIAVDGTVTAYNQFGDDGWDQEHIILGDASAHITNARGSADANFSTALDVDVFSFGYNMTASGSYNQANFNAMIELEIEADVGDDPNGEVFIYYDSAGVRQENGGELWISSEVFVDDARELDLGIYQPSNRTGRLGPFRNGSRLRYCRNDDDIYDWAWASVTARNGTPFLDSFTSLTLVQCGSGTPECPKPVVLLITGAGVDSIQTIGMLQSLASSHFFDNGWQPGVIPNASVQELQTALANPCVRGLHIVGHGVPTRSAMQFREQRDGMPDIIRRVTAADLAAMTRGRQLDFVAPLGCNQYKEDWRAAFPAASNIIMPLYTHGAFRKVLSGDQYDSARFLKHSTGTPACPDKAIVQAPEIGAYMATGYGLDCQSFLFCNDDGCGHDVFPAIACGSFTGVPVAGMISATAPDGSFAVDARYESSHCDTTAVYGTAFSAIPVDLLAETLTSISRHIAANAITVDAAIVPQSFDIAMSYEESDLQAAGVTDESTLQVYWISGPTGGQFVPAAIDTQLNEVTFTVAGGGIGGIYGQSAFSAIPVVPESFVLYDAAPNPFNPQTTIAFDLSEDQSVSLHVYDMGGRLVGTLLDDEPSSAGRNEVVWRGRDQAGRVVPAGVYFYRLESGGHSETKMMALVK